MGSANIVASLGTYVSELSPNLNYGTATGLALREGTGNDAITYLYWSRPFPLKATVVSAKIKVYTTVMSTGGTHTLTLLRMGQSWSQSKMTWNTRPVTFIAGAKNVSKSGTLPSAQEWEFDVTDWMQTVSSGGNWQGVQVKQNLSVLWWLYSENHPTEDVRPRLEVVWSDAPATPTGLAPSGGRAVGVAKPTLTATYLDVSGNTVLTNVQVQINATDVWTSPTFDSGTVATSDPELDLNLTAYAGVTEGATVFWRIRFQDGAGIWSPWSTAASFKRDTKGTLSLDSPPATTDLVTATSLPSNPRAGSASTYWSQQLIGGGAATFSRQTTGGPPDSATFLRTAYTTASTSIGGGIGYNLTPADATVATAPGVTRSASIWVRVSKVQRLALAVRYQDAAGTVLAQSSTQWSVPANTWTVIKHDNPNAAPASTTNIGLTVYSITGTDGSLWGIGDTLDTTIATVVNGGTAATPAFDGGSDPIPGVSYRWTGTPNASTSERYVPANYLLKTEDTTPNILWTLTGETQAHYQLQVTHRIGVSGFPITDWDSGKVSSTTTAKTIPPGKINEPAGTVYTLSLRVWDNKQRESVPGSPTYQEVVRDFAFVPGATTGTTGLTAVTAGYSPKMVLTWQRTLAPDRFNVFRNGRQIAAGLSPEAAYVSGTTYTWTDETPQPGRSLTYTVQAVVNDIASATNATAVGIVRPLGIWLREPTLDLELCITGADDRDYTLGETSAALQSIAPNANKVLINQTLGGLEGRVEGLLIGTTTMPYAGKTAAQWRDIYLKMRNLRVKRFYLTIGDYSFQVVCQNFTYGQKATGEAVYKVGFDFFQQDDINRTLPLGS